MPEIAYLVQYFLSQNYEKLNSSKDFEECCKILDKRSKEIIEAQGQNELKLSEAQTESSLKVTNLRMKCKEEFYISNQFFKTLE